jgi:hypothetical protein
MNFQFLRYEYKCMLHWIVTDALMLCYRIFQPSKYAAGLLNLLAHRGSRDPVMALVLVHGITS